MAKAGRGDDQYMLRFPPGLRDRIKQAADVSGRSMNTEIIHRLEAYENSNWVADLSSAHDGAHKAAESRRSYGVEFGMMEEEEILEFINERAKEIGSATYMLNVKRIEREEG